MAWTAIIKSTEDWQHGLTSQGRLIGQLVSRGSQFTAHPNSRHPNQWCWHRWKGKEHSGKQTQCCCCWTVAVHIRCDFLSPTDMVLKLQIWNTSWSSLAWSFCIINFKLYYLFYYFIYWPLLLLDHLLLDHLLWQIKPVLMPSIA